MFDHLIRKFDRVQNPGKSVQSGLFFDLILALAVGFAPIPVAQAMLNGERPAENSKIRVGFLVSYPFAKTSTCVATLIDSQVVITAAHCVGEEYFCLGNSQPTNHSAFKGATCRRILRNFPHPKFSSDDVTGTTESDLALLEVDFRDEPTLPEPIVLGRSPLRKWEKLDWFSIEHFVGGYRASHQAYYLASFDQAHATLRYAGLVQDGRDGYEASIKVSAPSSLLSCFGDSGSPIFDSLGRIVGVLSMGPKGGEDNCAPFRRMNWFRFPYKFTSIHSNGSWIQSCIDGIHRGDVSPCSVVAYSSANYETFRKDSVRVDVQVFPNPVSTVDESVTIDFKTEFACVRAEVAVFSLNGTKILTVWSGETFSEVGQTEKLSRENLRGLATGNYLVRFMFSGCGEGGKLSAIESRKLQIF